MSSDDTRDDDATIMLPDEPDKNSQANDDLRRMADPMYALHMDMHDLFQQVQALNDKVDARLHDTRPIWEAVQTQIAEFRTEMNEQLSKLNKKLDIMNRELLEVKAEQSEQADRIDKLERKPS
jgi:predicted RNase H-like nuclease (RuvC/YqgF family)